MLGCEIRNYARLGMGYMTAFVALIGFYVGYIPYASWKDFFDRFAFDHPLLPVASWPDLFDAFWQKVVFALVYFTIIAVILALSVWISPRKTRLSLKETHIFSLDRIVLKRLLRGYQKEEMKNSP